jgi:uncharacterized protein YbaP (TraB family)
MFVIRATLGALLMGTVSSAAAKSCLWKIESGTGTLYLQGSVHLLKAEDYPLAPEIEEAYSNSDVLVLEADMQEMLDPATQQKIMAKAMLPAGKSLKTELSAESYAALARAFEESGLPIAMFETFKPWFASMTVVMSRMQKMGFDPGRGLDQHFYYKAAAEKKQVIGLESVDFQIDLFDSLARGNEDAYLDRTLEELAMLETMLDELITSWKKGDIETLGKTLQESFEDYPELKQKFLLDRNKTWVSKLNKLLKSDKTHMVVVGAAHIPGEGGLLELLEKKGCKITQL